jgi:hypothetical protein
MELQRTLQKGVFVSFESCNWRGRNSLTGTSGNIVGGNDEVFEQVVNAKGEPH